MADRVGQQLGNYCLVRILGQGNFAEVYLGEHVHLGTPAAIKILRTYLTSDDMEKFRREARIIARLEHPNIVRLLDFGIEGSNPFLVLQYAPNGTIRQRYPKGIPLSLETILPYVKQIGSALQYIHDKRLIHRDIKPENLLLGSNNEVLLSDFGIAVVAQSTSEQGTQKFSGTPPYAAPEQLLDKPRKASDQYSFGIVVYEWLTGERPFQGEAFFEVALKHVLTPPPPLRNKISTISPAVEEVVLKALEKDPHQRFTSVQDLATALEKAAYTEEPSVEQFSDALISRFQQHSNTTSEPKQESFVQKQAEQVIGLDRSSFDTVEAPKEATTSPFSQKTKEQWMIEGDIFFRAKRYGEAIAAYDQAIKSLSE